MASARVSVWAAQKLSSAATTATTTTTTSPTALLGHHLTPLHPAWQAATRRFRHIPFSVHQNYYVDPPLQRWKQNISKLYARRLLELAAASAATHQSIARLEQATTTLDKPVDWQDWERKDWADELLSSIGSNRLSRFWSATYRLASLACLAAPLTILYPLSRISETAERWSWSYGLWGIEHAGPTFLKLAQWATTRHDLFSPEFCQYFGKLRDDTRGHSWRETLKVLEKDLGLVSNHIELEKEPIGSGCIAQVYRGNLKKATGQYPAGTEVAVKVQHPGIWHKVCVDFYIMGKFARFLEGLPWLNLEYLSIVDSVEQFRDIMLPQLDLTIEAKNLQRFNRDFTDDRRVSFPHPIHGLTTEHVLTETFLHGKPILEFAKELDPSGKKELAYLGLETTLKMIFLNDFLHGDLHPGKYDCIHLSVSNQTMHCSAKHQDRAALLQGTF